MANFFSIYNIYINLLLILSSSFESRKMEESARNNIQNTCSVSKVHSFLESFEGSSNDLYLIPFPPAKSEVFTYDDLPDTLTKANSALGVGTVKGTAKAQIWANSTTNSWQLPPEHPRNNKTNCVHVSIQAGIQSRAFYTKSRTLWSDFYVIQGRRAIIHDTGTVMFKCGYVQLHEGCETIFKFIGRKWQKNCHAAMSLSGTKWDEMWNSETIGLQKVNTSLYECGGNSKFVPTRYKRVFIISASWDHNYHHFLSDSLSKLARHIDFLQRNPDIRIHIRSYEQYSPNKSGSGKALRVRLLESIGLSSDRLISGPIVADEVFIPRSPKCNDPLGHIQELRLLSKRMQRTSFPELNEVTSAVPSSFGPPGMKEVLARIQSGDLPLTANSSSSSSSSKRKIVFAHRPCSRKVKKGKLSDKVTCDAWREWDDGTIDAMVAAFSQRFPSHEVVVMSAADPAWMNCLSCQIRVLALTDILVGIHGAGLTNMIFMPPGSMVFEIVGIFDGRMLPVCGYHGPLAAGYGLHHYLHYYDWKGGELLIPDSIAHSAHDYFSYLNSALSTATPA